MVGNLRAKPLDAGSGRFVVEGNPPFLSGYPVGTSKHVPYTANAAKLIFGDWNQLLIGLWSALLDGLGSANKSRSLIGPDPRKDEMLRFALGQITSSERSLGRRCQGSTKLLKKTSPLLISIRNALLLSSTLLIIPEPLPEPDSVIGEFTSQLKSSPRCSILYM